MKPPTTAPTIPITMVTMTPEQPPPVCDGTMALAIRPAMSPRMIQARMLREALQWAQQPDTDHTQTGHTRPRGAPR